LQDRVRREFFAKKVEEMLLLRTQQRDLIFEVVGFLISFPHSYNSLQILPSRAICMYLCVYLVWFVCLSL
jgi:hypothetical protein